MLHNFEPGYQILGPMRQMKVMSPKSNLRQGQASKLMEVVC